MLHDASSQLYFAVGALLAIGLASALFTMLRWPDPRRRVSTALALAVLFGGSFVIGRRMVGSLDREGGTVLVYEVDVDRAIANERDRRFDEVRDAAVEALGLRQGAGRPTAAEMRKLRAQVSIDKPRDRRDEIDLILAEGAGNEVLDAALKRTFAGLDVRRERGRRATLRISGAGTAQIREHARDAVASTLRRRADALGLGAAVTPRGGQVAVMLPVTDPRALAEIRDILGQTARVAFKLVDDEEDFFEALSRAPEAELPRGVTFALENAPIGGNRTKVSHYARLVFGDGEDPITARRRFETWIATLPVDADHDIAVGKLLEYDEQHETFEEIGWRTYYLSSRTELDGEMVRNGHAFPDPQERSKGGWLVRMELTTKGADRFEEITAQNVKRRFAITLDGQVESAPVIQSRIPGGVATITMGTGSAEQQRRDAQRLELVLLSGALPAPVMLQQQFVMPPLTWKIILDRGLLGAAAGMSLSLLVLLISARRRT
ncbi:Protein-export membrane protein SecD [Minicystis rosea]|nr:Protein-export membrane protein SecD [Minicystis rosea]